MNILIIGGLGYLGSDLTDKLRKFCTVTILDPDLYESAYAEHCSGIELIKENLCAWDQGDRTYDCILVCSEIDIEEFYDAEVYRGYLFAYSRALKKLAENNAKSMIVYFTSPEGMVGNEHSKWKQQFTDHFDGHDNFIPIECPILYGDNVVVRSDTIVNNAVHNFLTYQAHVLETNPFQLIKFQNVLLFAQDICDFVTDGQYKDKSDCLQALSLVNAIQWSMVGGNEYRLSISAEVAHISDVDSGIVGLSKPEAFKAHLNMMVNALNNGMTNELYREVSNRKAILQSAISGKKVNEKLNI